MASEPASPAAPSQTPRRRRWLWLLLPLVLVAGPCGLGAIQTQREEPAIRARMTAFRDTVIRGESQKALAFIRRPKHGFDASRAGDVCTSYWLIQTDHWREADISVSVTGRHATVFIGTWPGGDRFQLHKDADGLWYFTGELENYYD